MEILSWRLFVGDYYLAERMRWERERRKERKEETSSYHLNGQDLKRRNINSRTSGYSKEKWRKAADSSFDGLSLIWTS